MRDNEKENYNHRYRYCEKTGGEVLNNLTSQLKGVETEGKKKGNL